MSDLFMFVVLALCACFPVLVIRKYFLRRIEILERDLQDICSVVSHLAEMQADAHRKFSASMDNLEERIMELSVPSHDSNLPLERRHQVLTLARQGLTLEDIVKRLNAPVGEAELILNLGKYNGAESSSTAKYDEQVIQYA